MIKTPTISRIAYMLPLEEWDGQAFLPDSKTRVYDFFDRYSQWLDPAQYVSVSGDGSQGKRSYSLAYYHSPYGIRSERDFATINIFDELDEESWQREWTWLRSHSVISRYVSLIKCVLFEQLLGDQGQFFLDKLYDEVLKATTEKWRTPKQLKSLLKAMEWSGYLDIAKMLDKAFVEYEETKTVFERQEADREQAYYKTNKREGETDEAFKERIKSTDTPTAADLFVAMVKREIAKQSSPPIQDGDEIEPRN